MRWRLFYRVQHNCSHVNLSQHLPIRADWEPSVQPRCVKLNVELTIISPINAITDFLILAFPIPLIWRPHMLTERKSQICCTFLLRGLQRFDIILLADRCAHRCWVQYVRSEYTTRATFVSRVSPTDGSCSYGPPIRPRW